jgi:hypothetical protein
LPETVTIEMKQLVGTGQMPGALLIVAVLSWAGSAHAQVASRDSLSSGISGQVVRAASNVPIDAAVVSLKETGRSVTTSATGAYELLNVAPGTYTLNVRRLGYAMLETQVTLEAHRVLEADLELDVSAAHLAGVAVRADSTRSSLSNAIAERMKYNAGAVFFLRAELDSARDKPVSDLLGKRAHGGHLVMYPSRGAILLATSRAYGTITRVPRADPADSKSPKGCFSQVYVDGVQIYTPVGNSPAPDLGRFSAGILEAVEFYPGPASTPAQYRGDGAQCGTLLLWTRVN